MQCKSPDLSSQIEYSAIWGKNEKLYTVKILSVHHNNGKATVQYLVQDEEGKRFIVNKVTDWHIYFEVKFFNK